MTTMLSEPRKECDDVLSRLLHPAPLITGYDYWQNTDGKQVALCTPQTEAVLAVDSLMASGLELMGSFRLLQEMDRQHIHRIAPMGLTVSMAWLGYPGLPDMLGRLLKTATDRLPLMLYLEADCETPVPECLFANVQKLRQQGVKLVLNAEMAGICCTKLSLLCDGVRYPLSLILMLPEVRTRIRQFRMEGKFIQVTGISGISELRQARMWGGDHFLIRGA
ncbi:TPA: hypothetical protein ROG05_000655 [Enterobacter soli]|nr:hypothetical protein [Enterobacter soli]